MSELSNVDFTDAAQVYRLHGHLAGTAAEAKQIAGSAHDVREVDELTDAVEKHDIAHWDVEAREASGDPQIQSDLNELAASATGLHGVAEIIKTAKANTAEGILDMSNILAAGALDAHGGAWYDDAVDEHYRRGFSI